MCTKKTLQKKLPKKKSILLTFDDGYIDHWKYVFPYLKEKKITGNFYPPTQAIKNKKVLNVNKVRFILAKERNRKKILNYIFKLVSKYINFARIWPQARYVILHEKMAFGCK